MRVLHVINQFCDSAGAEVSLREFLTSSAGRQIENAVAVLTDTSNDFRKLEGSDVELFVPRVPTPSRFRAFRHVSDAIGTFRPDLVHTSLFEADLIGRVAARRHRTPTVSTLVNMPWAAQGGTSSVVQRAKFAGVRALDRCLARYATDCFHAVADAVADATADAFGLQRERFTVVHRGRSTAALGRRSAERHAQIRHSLERELGRPLDAPVLLAVGREAPVKNQALLLRLLPDLRVRHPGVVLMIAGRAGAATGEMDQLVRDNDLEDAVVRLGLRKDIPDLLAAADAFIFPSRHEGAAGAVIEAMAMEVPVVGSDIPALRELLEGGRCGKLAPLNQPGAFVRAIDEVLEGGPTVSERVKAARARFEQEFELEAVGRAMVDLYASVLSAKANIHDG